VYSYVSSPNCRTNHNLLIGNKYFENEAKVIYLGTIVTNKNLFQKEIKSRLNSGNATILFSLLSSRLLFKNLKIKIYKTIMLLVVLYGCETWSVTVREGCR